MALTAAGLIEPARAAFEWSRRTQRADGSWPIQFRGDVIEDANADSNFCAYIAAGVWHHFQVTGDHSFAERMWPTVRPPSTSSSDSNCPVAKSVGLVHLRCAPGSAADRFGQHLPQHPVRVGAGGSPGPAAAGMGGGRRPWGTPSSRTRRSFADKPHHSMGGRFYPIPRRRPARFGRRGPDRRSVGRFRGQRPGHPLRRRPPLGHWGRDPRVGTHPGRALGDRDRAPWNSSPICSTCASVTGPYWTGPGVQRWQALAGGADHLDRGGRGAGRRRAVRRHRWQRHLPR